MPFSFEEIKITFFLSFPSLNFHFIGITSLRASLIEMVGLDCLKNSFGKLLFFFTHHHSYLNKIILKKANKFNGKSLK